MVIYNIYWLIYNPYNIIFKVQQYNYFKLYDLKLRLISVNIIRVFDCDEEFSVILFELPFVINKTPIREYSSKQVSLPNKSNK